MRTLADFEADCIKRRQTKEPTKEPKSNSRRRSSTTKTLKNSIARLRGTHHETVEINKMLSAKLAAANKQISDLQDLGQGLALTLETLQLALREMSMQLENEKDANAELRAKNIALEVLTQ
jgi:hypothetical protein